MSKYLSATEAELVALRAQVAAMETERDEAYETARRDADRLVRVLNGRAQLQADITTLTAERDQWCQFAAYCRSCALAGESDPQTFAEFLVYLDDVLRKATP